MLDDHTCTVDVTTVLWGCLSDIADSRVEPHMGLRSPAIWSSCACLAYAFRDSPDGFLCLPLSLPDGDPKSNLGRLSSARRTDVCD